MTPEKGSSMPPIPKPDDASKAFFEAAVPDHPAVKVRPMFGNLAAFVNGNMFMGMFGPELFLRLPEGDREAVAKEGGGPFEPMPGRPMREYAVLPSAWRDDLGTVREWVSRSLEHAQELPPKEPKSRAVKKRG
jgi:TfoX/Sxy family transcriptional regulator of competence genes